MYFLDLVSSIFTYLELSTFSTCSKYFLHTCECFYIKQAKSIPYNKQIQCLLSHATSIAKSVHLKVQQSHQQMALYNSTFAEMIISPQVFLLVAQFFISFRSHTHTFNIYFCFFNHSFLYMLPLFSSFFTFHLYFPLVGSLEKTQRNQTIPKQRTVINLFLLQLQFKLAKERQRQQTMISAVS